MTPIAVSVKTGASMLGISASALRQYIDQGVIPIIKLPSASAQHQGEPSRRVLIAVRDLESFVDAHRVQIEARR